MNFVSDLSELWKGLSDIPLALLAGIFAFSFSSKKRAAASPETEPAALPETELTASSEKCVTVEPYFHSAARRNSLLFACICFSSLIGIILHCFSFTRRQLDYGWTVLYLILYFCLWLFYGAMVSLFSQCEDASDTCPEQATSPSASVPSLRTAGLFFAVCCIITIIVLYIFEGPDIIVFAAAALFMVIPIFVLAMKNRRRSLAMKNRPRPRGFGLLFFFLLAAVCCQFLSGRVPFIVAGEHVFLCAALCCLQRILRNL